MLDDRRWDAAPFPPAHAGCVRALAFSPDGERLITGAEDGVVRMWHVARGELVHAFAEPGGRDGIAHLAWAGDWIYVTTYGHTRRVHRRLAGRDGATVDLGDVADARGTCFVSRDPDDRDRLRWWDVPEGRLVRTTPAPTAHHWRLGPAPGTLVAFEGDTFVTLDPGSGAASPFAPIPPWHRRAQLAAFAVADDGTIAAATESALWLYAPGSRWLLLAHDLAFVYALAFSPDGARLALADNARAVHLFDVASGNRVRTLPRANAGVDLSFAPDGREVHVLHEDGAVATWDLRERRRAWVTRLPSGGAPTRIVNTPEGLAAVTVEVSETASVVTTWDVMTAQPLVRMSTTAPAWGRRNLDVAWPWIACGTREGRRDSARVEVWDARTGATALTEDLHERQALVAMHPRGLLAVNHRAAGGVRILDVVAGTAVVVPLGFERDWLAPFAFSPDGERLVCQTSGPILVVVELSSGCATPVEMVRSGASACAWSPDGRRLAVTRGYDRGVAFWREGQYLAGELSGHRGRPRAAAFSPDGRRLATTGEDGQVILWSAATGRRLLVLP